MSREVTSCARGLACLALLAACGGGGGGGGTPGNPDLERYDAGFFAIDKPRGWNVHTAGSCETFAFLLQDPQEPLGQVFYFGTIGRVYTTEAQKEFDAWYVSQGGYAIPWIDAPAIDPLTPENFMAHWPEIAHMSGAGTFMARFPHLEGLKLVSSVGRATLLPGVPHTATGESRGIFQAGAEVGEGMFLATVAGPGPFGFCTDPPSSPSGCTGNGHFVCGVTAPKAAFPARMALLIASLNSFTITQRYVDDCLAQAQRDFGAVAEAGRTLSEASDILWDGWQARSRSEDISAERYGDGFRGVDRVYDPDTGTVYEVPVGWYDGYDANRSGYAMGDLQLLPSDVSYFDLWMRAPLGADQIR
jgi:hypothetical protein